MSNADDIAALKQELSALKSALAPPPAADTQAMEAWRSQMHQLRERRMAHAANFSVEELREMQRACPDDVMRDIVAKGMIPGPSQAGASGQVTSTHPGGGARPVNSSGWREAAPLGPRPGINHVDRILDHADAQDRAERIREAAHLQALQKAIKP